jgi:hypothetical protein
MNKDDFCTSFLRFLCSSVQARGLTRGTEGNGFGLVFLFSVCTIARHKGNGAKL